MLEDNLTIQRNSVASMIKLRQIVLSMLHIFESEEATLTERRRAASTIRDALQQTESGRSISVSLDQHELGAASRDRTVDYMTNEIDLQEARFAEKLKDLMKARAITQSQLAVRVGCSQPAISQMLKRQCRPQRNTILNLAAALDVDARELWPNLEVTDILDAVASAQQDSEMTESESDAIRRSLDSAPSSSPARRLPSRQR
jgi:transcriptional regulator with XRE-family HTH domain